MSKKKIAITGGSGFIGRYFIEKYYNKYDILLCTRNFLEHPYCEVVKTDYSQKSLQNVLEGCNAILHLAGNRPHNNKRQDFLNNVILDHSIFQTAHELGISNIVFASSRGVYGQTPTPWKENSAVKPNNLYALAKLQSEMSAEYFNNKGMNIKSLRFTQIFGFGEYEENVISKFIKNCIDNKPITITVKGIYREYIYVKDLADALDKALSKENKKGVFNIGSGEVFTIEQIAYYLAEAFGRQNLVQMAQNCKTLNEKSLMDSTLFMETFKWQPQFTLKEAAADIANNFRKAYNSDHASY